MSYKNVEECMEAAKEQAEALRKAYADGMLEEYLDEEFLKENLCKAMYDMNGFTDFELDNLNGLKVSYMHIDVVGVDGSHYEDYLGTTNDEDKEMMNAMFDYIQWIFDSRNEARYKSEKYSRGY